MNTPSASYFCQKRTIASIYSCVETRDTGELNNYVANDASLIVKRDSQLAIVRGINDIALWLVKNYKHRRIEIIDSFDYLSREEEGVSVGQAIVRNDDGLANTFEYIHRWIFTGNIVSECQLITGCDEESPMMAFNYR